MLKTMLWTVYKLRPNYETERARSFDDYEKAIEYRNHAQQFDDNIIECWIEEPGP